MVNIQSPVKATLFRHQMKAYEFALRRFGLLPPYENKQSVSFLMSMGCGKSLTSIATIGALYHANKIKKILIVTPLSVLGVWCEEFLKFADFNYNLKILTGSSENKSEQIKEMKGDILQVTIINYESVWRLEKELSNWNPELIIADESHKIKTHNISASKAMHRLGINAKYRLILTGTLITNKPLDVFSQYKFLQPEIFGKSFYAFRNRYFYMGGYGNHTPILLKSMENELTEKIHSIAFRATKDECLDLPETIEVIRHVELEPKALRIYKGLVKESYSKLGDSEISVTNVLTRVLRLSQLTGGFLGDDEGNKPQNISKSKLQALEDIIDDVLNEGKKIVVIARFIPEIKSIRKMLENKKIKYSVITGEIKNRDQQVSEFQNNPDVKVFVGQISTAGLGITLTTASTMVFYSMDYSMSNFVQTKARIHRVGQAEKCTYLYLIAKSTIDEKVLNVLKNKANLAKTFIDDYHKGNNPFLNMH